MATYSKYNGLPWESTSSDLIIGTANETSFIFTNNNVLENLIDNDAYYITPRYLRDMFISLWESTSFKLTSASGSNIEYIGIDSGAPNRDLEINKIFISKRSYSGTQSYTASHDLMSTDLISSDIDLFFNNTRNDLENQKNTRIVFLAGTNRDLFLSAPYLQSQVVTTPGGSQSLSMDIVNNSGSGNINIYSMGMDSFDNDIISIGGTVSINNIVFPTMATSSDLNYEPKGKTLIPENGVLSWKSIKLPQVDYVGITGSQFNIFGAPVNLNYHSLEFTDSRPIPISIGDMPIGSSFDRMSISDVLRKIIYPYLGPLCTINLINSNGYFEVGTYPNIRVGYSITKRTNSTLPTKLSNMIPSTYPPITTVGQTTISGEARGVVISPITATTSTFSIKVNDGTINNIASTSVAGIYPYFYGFTSSNTLTVAALESMEKVIEPKGDKTFDLTGSGNFFFAYDADYGPLTSIMDPDNNDIFATFSASNKFLSSPTGLWTSKEYIVYKWSNVSQVGPPSENFDFKY